MRARSTFAVSVVAIIGIATVIAVRRERQPPALGSAVPSVSASASSVAAAAPVPSPAPVEPVNVIVPGDRYAVVVRGAREHGTAMLFMGGMCVHPGGYAGAFQYTAAERGDLVALQADISCGGGPDSPVRMWSSDLDGLDRRVDAAFVAAGFGVPREVIVIGYSQGAERAAQLVARWPQKYSRAVLIASPIDPSPKLLGRARAVALMAGTYDVSLARMRSAAPALERSGVRAAFFVLPNAYHGQMGEAPEESMRRALDFVTSP